MTDPNAHRPRKRFGQHFLTDSSVVERIVDWVAPPASVALVEIGPGLGALSLPLLKRYGQLHALELDRDIVPKLERRAAGLGQLSVIQCDVLGFDFVALSTQLDKPLRLVGNLPYNISTPLVFHLCEQKSHIESMHFMLQKEVVDRLAAQPGDKAYGRLSIMAQYHCEVSPVFTVAPGSFNPPPRVDSAVVTMRPHKTPPFDVGDPALFQQIVTSAFSAPRKTLRNALAKLFDEERLRTAGIDPQTRAERVTPQEYAALSRQLGG
ncbi:MAG: 16S rRNA (adenine(1518)-N(6)/adenine(1519)-N(6))-dimethyltransferase RsmA [Pseudomonadota bacterium]